MGPILHTNKIHKMFPKQSRKDEFTKEQSRVCGVNGTRACYMNIPLHITSLSIKIQK